MSTSDTLGLPQARKFVRPTPDDDWASIAARELAGTPDEEAVGLLQSWNVHVFMRAAPPEDSPRFGNYILPSDIIFLEPPRTSAP